MLIFETVGKADSTCDRMVQHRLALMSRSGLEGVTVGVLADRVGMSKSGLLAHFRSKEEVQVIAAWCFAGAPSLYRVVWRNRVQETPHPI